MSRFCNTSVISEQSYSRFKGLSNILSVNGCFFTIKAIMEDLLKDLDF